MASVKLLVPAVLRRYSDGLAEIDVEADTVRGALEALFARFGALRERVLDPRGRLHPYLIVFRNDERAALDAEVEPGDVVEIVGAAEGG